MPLFVHALFIFGSVLFVCNSFAGIAVFLAMRRQSKTFILMGAMLGSDALFGLSGTVYGGYTLLLTSNSPCKLMK
jgi:hypothetical protein